MLRELRHVLPFFARYRWIYLGGCACLVLSTLLKILIPRILKLAVDRLHEAEELGVREAVRDEVVRYAAWIAGLALLVMVVRTASRVFILGGARLGVHDLRNQVFDKLLRLAPSYYARTPTGQLMSRGVNDVTYVQSLLGPVLMYLAETAVLYVFCLGVLMTVSPLLTVVAFAPFPFFVFAARRQAATIQTSSRAAQEELGRIAAKADESLGGHAVLTTLGVQELDAERFDERAQAYRDRSLEVSRARASLVPMITGLAAVSIFLVLAVGGPMVVRGTITVGDFVMAVTYLTMMAAPTRALGFVISSLRRGAAAIGRLQELFEAPLDLTDPAEPARRTERRGGLRVEGLTVDLQSGEEGDGTTSRRVLSDVTFEVPAGSTLGVVGRTGSGKSVLARVLARQLPVEPGRVFLDGVDVTRLTLDEVRAGIGYAPQDGFLFSRSLRENVRLGVPDAGDEDVLEALRIARLDKDLDQLPQGLDTRVGEQGLRLSGGQRQRASLARAVLPEPELLLLDDTLSAVDAHTSEEILTNLRPVMADRTTVIVAHRIASVRDADQILVLEDGRVAERGTHDELVQEGGFYAQLYERQQLVAALSAELELEEESR